MIDRPMNGVLIGAGFFAQFQAEAWKRLEGRLPSRPDGSGTDGDSAAGKPPLQLAAVVDSAPGKARAFADQYGIPSAYESVDAALEAEQPDFVDIATRPESHLALTRTAAQRGVHVICQKPMAPAWEDCLAMCDACEQAGVRLLIHENWRWQPWYRETKRIIEAGTLGRVFQVTFLWRTGDGKGDKPYPAQPYFKDMPRLLVFETLVHILDTYRYLFGEITGVYCQNRRLNPVIAGEDQSLIQVMFADGRLGLIDANRISGPMPAPVAMGTLVVIGDQATLRMSPDGRLWLSEAGQAETALPFAPPTDGYKGDSVYATQAHLLESLRTGRSSESDGRDYLRTVALVEACYRSAEQGRVVAPVGFP
jgi:D-apiose dehydrogenase